MKHTEGWLREYISSYENAAQGYWTNTEVKQSLIEMMSLKDFHLKSTKIEIKERNIKIITDIYCAPEDTKLAVVFQKIGKETHEINMYQNWNRETRRGRFVFNAYTGQNFINRLDTLTMTGNYETCPKGVIVKLPKYYNPKDIEQSEKFLEMIGKFEWNLEMAVAGDEIITGDYPYRVTDYIREDAESYATFSITLSTDSANVFDKMPDVLQDLMKFEKEREKLEVR